MLNTIIVDDEIPARLRLSRLCLQFPTLLKVVGEAATGWEAVELVEKLAPQLLLLDIQLPDMNGFDILKNLSYRPLVIFCTAHSEYALQAFENLSVDYLVKPIAVDRFAKSMDKLQNLSFQPPESSTLDTLRQILTDQKQQQNSFAMAIKQNDGFLLVDYEDISHIQAEDKYSTVFTKDGGKFLSEKSLAKLESELPSSFLRVHRSFIINQHAISQIKKYFKGQLVLILNDSNQSRIITGETYTRNVRSSLGLK